MDTEIELKFLVSDDVIPLIPSLITQFAKTVTNKPSKVCKMLIMIHQAES